MSFEEVIFQMDDQTLPFKQTEHDGYFIRSFDPEAPAHLYKWHFDEADREVTPLNLNDWRFQFDNEMPQPFDETVFIEAGRIHRLIPGNTPLNVRIVEKYP